MKSSSLLWAGVSIYFLGLGALYLIVSGELAGATLLLGASLFGGLVAGWLIHANRSTRNRRARAEDRNDADMGDAVGIVGVYPTASLRPLVIGAAFAGMFLGLAIGLWMTYASVAIVASQVTLMARDADR